MQCRSALLCLSGAGHADIKSQLPVSMATACTGFDWTRSAQARSSTAHISFPCSLVVLPHLRSSGSSDQSVRSFLRLWAPQCDTLDGFVVRSRR